MAAPQGFECQNKRSFNNLGEAGGTENSLLQPIAVANGPQMDCIEYGSGGRGRRAQTWARSLEMCSLNDLRSRFYTARPPAAAVNFCDCTSLAADSP